MNLADLGINQENNEIKFDLIDDALIYMRNDPQFYRKEYFPTITKMAEQHRAGSLHDPDSIISPMVSRGINSYCKKYKLANMPDDIFHEDHRRKLVNKIREDELKEIQKGEYQ